MKEYRKIIDTPVVFLRVDGLTCSVTAWTKDNTIFQALEKLLQTIKYMHTIKLGS